MNDLSRIGDHAKIRRGASPRPIGDPKYFGGSVGWVRISDVTASSKYLKTTTQKVSNLGESLSVKVNKGDLIMSICGTIGKPIIIAIPACIHDGFVLFYDVNNDEPEYLYYLLQFHETGFIKKGQPGTQINLNTSIVGNFRAYFPKNKSEQRIIAIILSTIDKVIEKTVEALKKYEAIKAGMMQDLFTRGIDTKTGKLRPAIEESQELYKESELGWIPKDWEIATLSEVCGMKSGDCITSKSVDEYGRYPVYGGNGLRGFTSNYTHEGSYVLIGRQGALCGNVNRVDGKFFASEHAVVVSVNSDKNVDWLSYILDSMNLNTYSEASAQPGLAVSKILRLKIRVPKFNEQMMIASVIQSLNKKVEAETALHSEYKQIKKGLMADLLTGKVRVCAH